MADHKYNMAGDFLKGVDAYVYLVWGIRKDGRCDLIAIAADDEARDRYMETGQRKTAYVMVKHEMAMLNHLFGESMLPNALNRARR